MLKSDKQMERVKIRIINEQVRIKKYEEKKQKMQNIKFAKSVMNFFKIRSKTIRVKNNLNIKEILRKAWKIGKLVTISY